MNRTRRNRGALMAGFVVALSVALSLFPAAAFGYWSGSGIGTGAGSTGTLLPPTGVIVPAVSAGEVSVVWTASGGTASPTGYYILRTNGTATSAACDSGPVTLIAAVTCFDTVSVAGTYSYTVVAVYRSWTSTSTPSGTVAVTTFPASPAAPPLGRAASFSVLGTAATNGGLTTISGDLGTYPAVTAAGFPDGTVQGVTHTGDAAAAAAEIDLTGAYADAAGRTPSSEFAGDLNGVTFTPGVHHTGAALALSAAGVLTLDAQRNPNAVFIFQIDGALNTAAGSSVQLINGASAANVFWQVNGAAGTGALSTFSGTILAAGAITVGAGGTLIGRALSSGAVTLATNAIRFTVALPPTVTIDGGSTATGSATAPGFSGTTSASGGQRVTVTVSDQTLTTTVTAIGTWAVTGAPLPSGSYSVLVRVRDAAGNAATARQLANLL